MNINKEKDYYAILGVTPNAEDVVIRAAYKALMQRYHPDRSSEGGNETNKKATEINEAYRILSNSELRKEYDELRGTGTKNAGTTFEDNEAPKEDQEFIGDWNFACEYYPYLTTLSDRLKKISWRLSLAFQALLLETKAYDNAKNISEVMEIEFLNTYFGENEEIIDFSKELIFSDNREALKELNKAIRILGSPSDSSVLINKIRKKYGITKPQNKYDKLWCDELIEHINQKRFYKVKEYVEQIYEIQRCQTNEGMNIPQLLDNIGNTQLANEVRSIIEQRLQKGKDNKSVD